MMGSIAISSLEPIEKTLQNAVSANGNGTVFILNGRLGTLLLQISGTFSATVNFEGTVDGTNYIAIRGINKNSGNGATTATAAGIFQFSIAGIKFFRARISSYASGGVTVTASAIPANEPANQTTTTTGTVAIDQTTPGTTNAVQVTGSNVEGTLDATAPAKANLVGGKYILADPTFHDGDLVPLRTNLNGEQIIQVSRRKILISLQTLTSATTVVATTGVETIAVTPGAGKMWTIQALKLAVNPPSDATSGSHVFDVTISGTSPSLLYGSVVYNKGINYNYGQLYDNTNADLTLSIPLDKSAQANAVRGIKITAAHTLRIKYNNYTNVDQTGSRTIILSVLEEDIVS